MPSSFPPFSRALAAALGVGMPAIEVYAPDLAGDGATDDSAAIKSAHDAAYAAGVREVWVSKQHYAPTAYNLGNVIFRGPGALLGTYRKRVIPVGAAPANPSVCVQLKPADHLTLAAQSTSFLWQIVGDSTAYIGANNGAGAECLWEILQAAIQRDNPTYSPVGTNRAVPGSTYAGFYSGSGPGVDPGNYPSWYTITSAPWTAYTKNIGSLAVFIGFGANGSTGSTANVIKNVRDAITANYTIIPNIIWFTNLPSGSQYTVGSGTVADQDGRDWAAAATRAYAKWMGDGLIDLHRMGCMVRDGFDPCAQVFVRSASLAGTSQSLPYSLPYGDGDFDVTWTMNNTGGGVFGAGTPGTNTIDVQMGWDTSNLIRIAKGAGGQYTATLYAGAALTYTGIVSSSVAVPNGTATMRISARQDWVQIYAEQTLIYDGPFFRGSARFQPVIKYTSSAGSTTTLTLLNVMLGSSKLVDPALLDVEMYGSGALINPGGGVNQYSPPSGGEGYLHPASPAFEAIHKPILDVANFSLATSGVRPTQSITAAGAVSANAGVVKLTGPAAGTYAITLAAPRAQDAGRTLMIEMTSTTGANTVTLALTNVTGGTATTTCTWNAAAQKLVLVAGASKWEVIKQDGVTLT